MPPPTSVSAPPMAPHCRETSNVGRTEQQEEQGDSSGRSAQAGLDRSAEDPLRVPCVRLLLF